MAGQVYYRGNLDFAQSVVALNNMVLRESRSAEESDNMVRNLSRFRLQDDNSQAGTIPGWGV